uniref:Uncharacterized protein n=1 Tax=Anguilla anguilla TaxID=7936 RepID=A0A0E9WF79_ANGAN
MQEGSLNSHPGNRTRLQRYLRIKNLIHFLILFLFQ